MSIITTKHVELSVILIFFSMLKIDIERWWWCDDSSGFLIMIRLTTTTVEVCTIVNVNWTRFLSYKKEYGEAASEDL